MIGEHPLIEFQLLMMREHVLIEKHPLMGKHLLIEKHPLIALVLREYELNVLRYVLREMMSNILLNKLYYLTIYLSVPLTDEHRLIEKRPSKNKHIFDRSTR